MKKRNLLYAGLIVAITIALSSCFHDHDISIWINDDDDVYRMKAQYEEARTREVERIINTHLRQHTISIVDRFIDTDVTLEDGSSFHIRTKPGRLRINFDKTENSEESCERLKDMCEEIKEVIARGDDNK